MKKMTIAIDGYSSCGKSTLAKDLAKALNLVYVDSGAMYRAVSLFAMQHQLVSPGQVQLESLKLALPNIQIAFKKMEGGGYITLLNDKDVESEIRTPAVANVVSEISAIPEVRKKLVGLQQAMGEKGGVVMDGRDIGTVVFPNAELKLFVTAKPEIRAQRRFDELKSKGIESSLEAVLHNLQKRDHEDTTRKTDPLRMADDAIEIDNSELSKDQQLALCLKLAQQITSL